MKKPQDIQNLGERIRRFEKTQKKARREEKAEDVALSRSATGWQMSVEMLAAVIVGASIGYFADSVFHTAPWFLAVMTVFGGAAGVLNVYRTAHDEDKNNKESK
jgi:ATP synthase protein I